MSKRWGYWLDHLEPQPMTSQDTPELVERVALAITDCEAAGPLTLSAARVVARAAIEAMREPNDAMGAAGLLATDDSMMRLTEAEREAVGWADRLAGNPSKWMKPVWRAMIDAALEPRR